MKRAFSFFPSIIWAAIILWLSLLPGNDLPKWWFFELIHVDKWVHVTMYLIFSLLIFVGTFRYGKSAPTFSAQLSFGIIAMVYGILMEIFQQQFTTTRRFEWGDIVTDTIGAILGVLLARFALKKKMFFMRA